MFESAQQQKKSIKGTKKRTLTENCKFFFQTFPKDDSDIAHIMLDVTYGLLHFHKVLDNI